MGALNIDLTAIVAIWITGMLLLVALSALTLRFAVVPLLAAAAAYRAAARDEAADGDLRPRLEHMEGRLGDLERVVAHGSQRRPTVVG